MRRAWVREPLTAAALAVFVTLFFGDILFAGFNLYIRDVARTYYPERRVIAEILRSGTFPFWNPYVNGGQPLAANPAYAVFYPIQWLVGHGTFRNAFHLVVVLHFPLAAVGMYLLTRSLGARRVVAWLAGLTYALGGPMLSVGSLIPFLYSMAWLPWIGFFFHRALHKPNLARLAPAAVSLGLILLIGDVSMILQAGGLVAAYALYSARKQRSVRPVALAAATIILATLIGAAQIFPALEHQHDSGRSRALPRSIVMAWSMPPYRVVEMIWPTLFGSASPEVNFQWGLVYLYPQEAWPWVINIYPGILAAILIIAGFAARVRGSMFAGIVALLGYLLSIGRFGFLFPLLYRVGLQSLRYPEKFILSTMFVLTVFAAVVAEEAIRNGSVRKTVTIVAAVVTAITAVIAGITLMPAYPAWFARAWQLKAIDLDLAGRFRDGMLLSLALTAIVTILLAAERLSPRLRVALIGLVVIVDLGVRVQGWMPRITADYYDPPPAACALAAGPQPVRIYSAAEWEQLHAKPRPLPAGIVAWITRNGLFPAWEITYGFDGAVDTDVTSTNLLPSVDFASLFHLVEQRGRADRLPLLLQMAGASHAGIRKDLDNEILHDPRRFDEIAPVRFVGTDSEGPYYFAEKIVAGADARSVARAVFSNDEIPKRTVFVNMTPFNPAPGRVISARRTANTLTLDVEGQGRGFLALTVTPHKYWRATIDGKPAELHKANVGFQGVVVERGRHRVELRYRNSLVVASAWISALTALVLLVWCIGATLTSIAWR